MNHNHQLYRDRRAARLVDQPEAVAADAVHVRIDHRNGGGCRDHGREARIAAQLGLADRLEAHGGRLVVMPAAGGGTRVIGEIPCAS